MSYIHEALKKAQVEKDVQSPRYESLMAAPGKKSRSAWKRAVFWTLPFCLIILLAVLTFSWLSFKEQPALVTTGKISKVGARELKPKKEIPEPNVQELFLKAKNFQKNGLMTEAEQWYQKVVEADPGYVPALNNLGVIYLHGEKYSGARMYFEKAIRLNPGYVDPYYNLACLFAINGNTEQGLRYLRKAVSMHPQAKDWAGKDPDLGNLRSLPAFGEIIQ